MFVITSWWFSMILIIISLLFYFIILILLLLLYDNRIIRTNRLRLINRRRIISSRFSLSCFHSWKTFISLWIFSFIVLIISLLFNITKYLLRICVNFRKLYYIISYVSSGKIEENKNKNIQQQQVHQLLHFSLQGLLLLISCWQIKEGLQSQQHWPQWQSGDLRPFMYWF